MKGEPTDPCPGCGEALKFTGRVLHVDIGICRQCWPSGKVELLLPSSVPVNVRTTKRLDYEDTDAGVHRMFRKPPKQ